MSCCTFSKAPKRRSPHKWKNGDFETQSHGEKSEEFMVFCVGTWCIHFGRAGVSEGKEVIDIHDSASNGNKDDEIDEFVEKIIS